MAWHGAIVLTKDLEVKARGRFLSLNDLFAKWPFPPGTGFTYPLPAETQNILNIPIQLHCI